jgi:hypothetical protein
MAGTTAPRTRALARAGRLLRVVAYSLVPLVVLLVLLEVALAVAGLGDPDQRLSLMRGFDESARYLVPVAGEPGAYQTQMSDGRWPEVRIPPRDGRVRVLLLGGSNTRSFPEKHLEKVLTLAAPDPGFEVINLGRPGYGSERVRILLSQALAVLQPDIVFLYEGHNEFVERGFAAELAEQWSHPWIQRAADRLTRLRTINVLESLLESSRPPAAAAPAPEAWQGRDDAMRYLTWDQTQIFYEQLRANLRTMCREAQAAGVGLLLATSVSNMLEPPRGIEPDPRLTHEQARECQRLLKQAARLVPERFRTGWIAVGPGDEIIRLRPEDWGESMTAAALAAQRAERGDFPPPPALRTLLPPLDDGPFWSDPAGWRPKVDTILATTGEFCRRELQPGEADSLREAVALLEKAGANSKEPSVLHMLAVCLYLLGEDDTRAVELFRRAASVDRAPSRASDTTNAIVRDVAAEFSGAELVDTEALFRARCPDGLIGYEVMLDSCHLHSPLRPRLLDDLVPALLRLGAQRQGH